MCCLSSNYRSRHLLYTSFLACYLLRFSSIGWMACIGFRVRKYLWCIRMYRRSIEINFIYFLSQFFDTSPIRVSVEYRGIGVSDTYPIPVRHFGEVSVQHSQGNLNKSSSEGLLLRLRRSSISSSFSDF
jgi:hypothetical protein